MAKSRGNAKRITGRHTERKKKSAKNRIVKSIVAAVLIYLILSIVFSVRSGITTTIALNGEVKESIYADGYVFRDQMVISSPANGYIECRVSEGERVSQGQVVGYIYTGEYDASRFQQMQEINDRIEYLEKSASAAATYADNGVMAEQKIGVTARELSDMRQEHDVENTAASKEKLNILIERKRAMESGGSLNTDKLLTELKNQLYELENSTGGAKISLTTNMSGVFSSKIDGLEDKVSFEKMELISPAYLAELDNTEIQRNEKVIENTPVCKIVNNYEWYFAAVIDAEYAKRLQIGQRVELNFLDFPGATIYGNVRNISPEEGGKVAVTMYANRYVEGIYASSRASVEIITTGVGGIKLPVRSLHVKDGQTGVYVLRLGVARFVPVNVRYKNDEWAIVSAAEDMGSGYKLQIYDEVIVEARNLEDGKVVR